MGRLAVTNTLPCFLELCIPSLPLIHLSTLKFDVLVSPSLLNISDALNPPALYCFLFCCRLIRIKSSMLKLPKNQTKICLYKGDNLPVNSRAAEPWESFFSADVWIQRDSQRLQSDQQEVECVNNQGLSWGFSIQEFRLLDTSQIPQTPYWWSGRNAVMVCAC